MRVRVSVLSIVVGAMIPALLFAGPAIWAQDNAATALVSGGYKIGVVDRVKALTDYTKQKEETAKLDAEYKRLQAPIDALSKEIEAAKKKYDETKANMSEDEQKRFEDNVQEKFRAYKAELAKGDGAMDTMRKRSMEVLARDYIDAVKQVAQTGNYHIVLEADPNSPGRTVLYASDTVDITPQVITYLNSHTSARPPKAAPKATADVRNTAKTAKTGK
ncbi:MAG: OmpH family outer membrane protein [Candidatus Hydrogenedentes bacterium]|nr:OmpH family outer membrane protein [Candidatus Hydrogenedentota bacterium]